MKSIVYGLDIANTVFHVHALYKNGEMAFSRRLRRDELLPFFAEQTGSVIGIEASAAANHWGRELAKLGHEPRLISARLVKAFVIRHKNDRRDAAAIAEAVSRPSTPFRAPRPIETQGLATILTARSQLVSQRTALANCLRSLLVEFGTLVKCRGPAFRKTVEETVQSTQLPPPARLALETLRRQLAHLDKAVELLDRDISRVAAESPGLRSLTSMPGIGALTAVSLDVQLSSGRAFRRARDFSAFLGLVPRQNSSGDKHRLGGITKMGNRDLRKLLYIWAMSILAAAKRRKDFPNTWLGRLFERRPGRVALVAVANKLARIAWRISRSGEKWDQCKANIA